MPFRLSRRAEAMSRSTTAGDVFDPMALRAARDSLYPRIVRRVEKAPVEKASMARLADCRSPGCLGFIGATFAPAFAARWFTGDPIRTVAALRCAFS